MSTYQTIRDVDAAIAEQKRKIAELDELKKKMGEDCKTISEAGQLAIFLHDKLCIWNHTDGCAWHYEIHHGIPDWSGSAHAAYYERAANLLSKNYKCEEIIDIVNILKSY